jgi:predicted secreted protein
MGYVHDTHMSQYLPATKWHYATATMTQVAGQVAGTIAMHRGAADQTSVITIPIMIESNSSGGKGTMLKSIEVDYEILVAEPTSLTWVLNKVTRGADTAVAVVAAVTKTNTVADAGAKTVDQHKQTITITTPAWTDNDEYYLLQLSLVAGAGGNTADFLGAVANYTLRV